MHPADALTMQRSLADGRSVLVRGTLPAALPVPPGWAVLRVRCEVGARPLSPLREAAFRALQWLGEEHALDSAGVARTRDGARPEALARALNRLATKVQGGCLLLVEHLDAADDASLALLRRWVSLPGSIHMPLALAFTVLPAAGEARALFEASREGGAVEVVADSSEKPPETDWSALLRALAPEDSLTLRAAAVIGARFDAQDVAAARELPLLRVLETLQRCRELGAPLDDLGDDVFSVPDGFCTTMRAAVLPSLARHWQQRAGARHRAPMPPQMPRQVVATPAARVVVVEAPTDNAAPESAVRKAAPQPRARRLALDGTVVDGETPPDPTSTDDVVAKR